MQAQVTLDRKSGLISDPARTERKRRITLYSLSFAIPFVIMFIIYICMEVWPFGSNSVLVLDLNGQYVSFYEELRRIITEGGSLMYSWNRALGGEFMGIYAYYIASPFAFLVALFPKGMITEALLLIFLLKTGACGLTMAFYLDSTKRSTTISTVIFSSMYALSAYAIVQQHNSMWIDSLILFPILVYAIEQLVTRKKLLLYIITLAMIMLTHYYIGYMVCIFTVIYFFYYYNIYDSSEPGVVHEKAHFLKSFGRIAIASLIGLGMAMIIILPAYYSLTFGKTTFSDPSWEFTQRFDFLDFMVKLFPGSYDTVRPEGLPFVYVGSLALILVPLYFMQSKIRAAERIGGGILLSLLVILFDGSTFDLIMHGFQKPNWLNYRYSFIFSFFLVVFSYRAFRYIKEVPFKEITAICGVLGIMLLFIQKQDYEFLNDFTFVWYSFICLMLMIIGLYLVKTDRAKEFGCAILAIFVCFELCISGLFNTIALDEDVVYTNRTSYVDFSERVTPIVKMVQDSDDGFYRMEKTVHRKSNDNMMLNMKGLSNSTSTLNASVIELLRDFGLLSKSHWSRYAGSTPLTDALLGIKYVISEIDAEYPYYTKIYEYDDDLAAFKNPYARSVAYGISDAIKEFEPDEDDTAFEFMNDLVTAMLGAEDKVEIFKKVDVKTDYTNCDIALTTGHRRIMPEDSGSKACIIYTLENETDDEIFMYFPTTWPRDCNVTINGKDFGTVCGDNTDCIQSIGTFGDYEEDEIIVKLTLQEDKFYVRSGVSYFYSFDDALFMEVMEQLAGSDYIIDDFSDTHLSGSVTIPEGRTALFTTIPYDEGWKVTVDGEEVTPYKAINSLLAIDLVPGEHQVEFKYMPREFVLGAACSVICTLIYIALVVLTHLRRRKHKESLGTVMEELSEALTEQTGEASPPDESEEDQKE